MDKERLSSGSLGSPRSGRSNRNGTSRIRKAPSSSSSNVSQHVPPKVLPAYNEKKKKKNTWKMDEDNSGDYFGFNGRSYGGSSSSSSGSEHNEKQSPFSVEAKLYKESSSLSIFVPPKTRKCDDGSTATEGEKEVEMPLEGDSAEQIEAADDSSSSSSSNYEGSPQIVLGPNFQTTRSAPIGCIDMHGSNLRFSKSSQNDIVRGPWKQNIEELYRVKRDSRSLTILKMCKENDRVINFNSCVNPISNEDGGNKGVCVGSESFDTLDVSLDDWLAPVLGDALTEFIDNEVEDEESENDEDDEEEIEDSEEEGEDGYDEEEGEVGSEEEEEGSDYEEGDDEGEEEDENEDEVVIVGSSLDGQLESLSL